MMVAAICCAPQVRAHGASDSAYASYAAKLHTFYLLQCRQAAAYSLYAATTTFLPSVVVAVVLYYGGTLVLDGQVGPSFPRHHECS
jgi:ABC-type bacteriocin/lantibiotic exporter with double-glycine peptidase domain